MELQVGVKVFLKNSEGKYLLLHRNTETYKGVQGTWDIVGGRIHSGTSLIENLKREVFEEVGLTLTSFPSLVHAQDIFVGTEKHVVRLTYKATTEGELVLDTNENDAYLWLTKEELEGHEDLDVYVQEILQQGLL